MIAFLTACGNRNNKGTVQESHSIVQQELIDNGWKMNTPENGDLPASYGITPVRGLLDNYFDIEMGDGLNLVVKIVDAQTNKTIRYVFVRENSKANISQVPPGQYYLKMAFGHDWMINDMQQDTLYTNFNTTVISESQFYNEQL